MDQHRPFTDAGRQQIIERVQPQYLTHELITRNRAELSRFLKLQQYSH